MAVTLPIRFRLRRPAARRGGQHGIRRPLRAQLDALCDECLGFGARALRRLGRLRLRCRGSLLLNLDRAQRLGRSFWLALLSRAGLRRCRPCIGCGSRGPGCLVAEQRRLQVGEHRLSLGRLRRTNKQASKQANPRLRAEAALIARRSGRREPTGCAQHSARHYKREPAVSEHNLDVVLGGDGRGFLPLRFGDLLLQCSAARGAVGAALLCDAHVTRQGQRVCCRMAPRCLLHGVCALPFGP
jgi:hypothetical protein